MKRAFDVAATLAAALVLGGPLLCLCLANRIIHGSPVFFRQERAGCGGRTFQILKLRTMRDGPGDDAQRLTRWGRFLRASSLDELPELWNVLRGDMSLVGPRPLPTAYLERYTPEQARRHTVRPGLTGWAQVSGRNALSWEAQFRLDLWYVDHRSFLLDLRILGLTVVSVVRRQGINAPGEATRGEFTGSGTTLSQER